MTKQLPPDDADVNQMMAVFDKLERNTGTAKDEMVMAVNSFVARAQNIIFEQRQENDRLRAQIYRLRAQVDELTVGARVRANKQAILIQAMWHIREMSLYYHDREIATKVLTDIGELRS